MNNQLKGLLLTLSGVVLMSFESPIIRYSGLDGFTVAFFYGLCIIAATNLVMLFQGKKFFIQSYTKSYKGVLLAGFFMGLSNFCFVMAVTYAGIAKTVLILATAPIGTALIAWIFLKQKTPKRIFIATIFVFIGLYIILHDSLDGKSLIGSLFAFGCVLSFSTMFCVLSFYKEASRVGYVSVAGVAVCLFSLTGANLSVGFEALIPIILMGIFITPLSRAFLGQGTRYLIPAEVGLLVIAESILAPIWGWLFLDEMINTNTFIGGSIILVSLVVNSLIALKQAKFNKSQGQ